MDASTLIFIMKLAALLEKAPCSPVPVIQGLKIAIRHCRFKQLPELKFLEVYPSIIKAGNLRELIRSLKG